MLPCIYFRPGGLQSAVLYAVLALDASKVLYCMHVGVLRAPKCCTVFLFLALQPFKALYCMHVWPWRPPKWCTVCIFSSGDLQNAVLYALWLLEASQVVLYAFLARAPLQSALLDAVHTPSSTLRPSIRFCLPPPPLFYPPSDKPYFVTTDMMLGRSASDTNKWDFGV